VLFSLFFELFFFAVFQLTTAIPFVVAGCKGANKLSIWQVKISLFFNLLLFAKPSKNDALFI